MPPVPVLKRAVAVRSTSEHDHLIHIYADDFHLQYVTPFGSVTPSEMGGYHLRVNPRYDFAEVEQYLRQLGEVG